MLGGEIWINRRTGYIGPKPGDRHADPIYGEMIVQGQLFDLGQLQRPLQLRHGALVSGPGQTFADNFDGQGPSGPVTVKGLPLFSDARGSVTLPTITLSTPATTSATWAVSMPGPLGDSIGNGNVPGNPETRVPTLIHAGPVPGAARDRVAGRRHAAGDVPDFNLKVPSFTLGPISASFSLSHASGAADPWFGGGTITAAIPPLPTISIDANYDPQNALGFAIRSDDSIDFVGARIKTNIPLFDIAKLEALTVRFGTHPFYLSGDATFANAGPVDLVTVNGCLAYIYGQNTHRTLNLCPEVADGKVVDDTPGVRFRLAGDVKLPALDNLSLGHGYVEYDAGSQVVTLFATIDTSLTIAGFELGGIHVDVNGQFGNGTFGVFGRAPRRSSGSQRMVASA